MLYLFLKTLLFIFPSQNPVIFDTGCSAVHVGDGIYFTAEHCTVRREDFVLRERKGGPEGYALFKGKKDVKHIKIASDEGNIVPFAIVCYFGWGDAYIKKVLYVRKYYFHEHISSGEGGSAKTIVVDSMIMPGCSGGALINSSFELLGIASRYTYGRKGTYSEFISVIGESPNSAFMDYTLKDNERKK